jgi:hypothetical protein
MALFCYSTALYYLVWYVWSTEVSILWDMRFLEWYWWRSTSSAMACSLVMYAVTVSEECSATAFRIQQLKTVPEKNVYILHSYGYGVESQREWLHYTAGTAVGISVRKLREGTEIFHKSGIHVKILPAKRVTWMKFDTENSQIFDTPCTTCSYPGSEQPCCLYLLRYPTHLIVWLRDTNFIAILMSLSTMKHT